MKDTDFSHGHKSLLRCNIVFSTNVSISAASGLTTLLFKSVSCKSSDFREMQHCEAGVPSAY